MNAKLQIESSQNTALSATGCAALTLPATLVSPTRELFIGGGGSLWLTFANGSRCEHLNMIEGASYPYAVTKVEAGTTGTSASNIVAHF